MITDTFSRRKEQLQTELHQAQKHLELLPEGSAYRLQNGKYEKWYHTLNGKQSYLSKTNQDLISKFVYKKYLILHIRDLKDEIKAITNYQNIFNPSHLHTEKFLSNPSYSKLISPFCTPLSTELKEWMEASFETNTAYPENKIHKSISGNLLRSKSEAIIDMFLYQTHIPYRYECKLELSGFSLYPDFTIRHPYTGQTWYWEHYGMMDNENYQQKYYRKTRIYTENGILPSINLICTFETLEHPLSSEQVRNIIQQHFDI